MSTLYAALADRVLVVRGSGDDWTVRERLVDNDLECLAAAPDAPDRVFVGTVGEGLQRSTDGGDSWETTLDPGHRVTAVTVSPHDPDTVWVGTEPSRVYRSTDGGDSWEARPGLADLPSADRWSFPPRPDTHHVRWIAVDPRDPERLYVAIEAGALVRTDDGGETWLDRPDGSRRDNHTLRTHPDAPGRVYTAAGDGYAESTDGGDTWTYPQEGLDHRYVWGLAVDPADPDAVVVSAASGARDAHDPEGTSFVYRKTGDGAWERAMAGLPGPEGMARAVLDAHDGGFYALTNHGVYRSDGGREWDLCPTAWPAAYRERTPSGLAVVE